MKSLLLAHAVGPGGGVELELLIVALALLVAAFLTRPVEGESFRLPVVLLVLAVGLGAGSMVLPRLGQQAAVSTAEVSTNAIVSIVWPSEGQTVAADKPLRIELNLRNAPLARSAFSKAGGHLHFYVDGKLHRMPYSLTTRVTLEPGEHDLTVEYVDSRHESFDPPVQQSITVTAE